MKEKKKDKFVNQWPLLMVQLLEVGRRESSSELEHRGQNWSTKLKTFEQTKLSEFYFPFL